LIDSAGVFMALPAQTQTGRQMYNVLGLCVRLPNMWTQYFENELILIQIGTTGPRSTLRSEGYVKITWGRSMS